MVNEYSVFRLNHSSLCPGNVLSKELISILKQAYKEFIIGLANSIRSKYLYSPSSYSKEIIQLIRDFQGNLRIFPGVKKEISLHLIVLLSDITNEEIVNELKEIGVNTPKDFTEDYINSLQHSEGVSIVKQLKHNKPDLIHCLDYLKTWKEELLENDCIYIDKLIEKELIRRNIPSEGAFTKETEDSLLFYK